VFHNAFDAMKFSLTSQMDLFLHDWDEALYDHDDARKDLDLCLSGLSVRMSVNVGQASKFMNHATNRLSYTGPAIDDATAIINGVVDGGIVVVNMGVMEQLQLKFSHRVHEFGNIVMHDIGTWALKGADAPMPLLQITPEELSSRPDTRMEGGMRTLPYSMAPGIANDGTPVTLVFCMMKNADDKGGPLDDDEELNKDDIPTSKVQMAATTGLNIKTVATVNNGYVTKDSHDVLLLAFHTASEAVKFCCDVCTAVKLPEHSGMRFIAGVHTGIPSSTAANKASGRVDYLGPMVNTAARLMGLAASNPAFSDDQVKVGLSESTSNSLPTSIDSPWRRFIKNSGKFLLKGLDDEITVWSVNVAAVDTPVLPLEQRDDSVLDTNTSVKAANGTPSSD